MKKLIVSVFVITAFTGSAFASGVIDIAYSPYTITNPGSYLVVKNLTTAHGNSTITINTSDVTIDLNGHTLYGPGTTASSGGAGIVSESGDNITITNGEIRNYDSNGISLYMANAHISKMKILDCYQYAIQVDGGIIENNLLGQTGGGISCNNTIYPAVIRNNVVVNSSPSGSDYGAIEVNYNSDITGNTLNNNNCDVGIYYNSNCTITGNNVTGTNGVGISGLNGGNIIGNTVSSNSTDGIDAGIGCTLKNNNVYNNSGIGINVGESNGNNIIGNTVASNSGHGIYAYGSGCRVSENVVYSNGGSGISVHNGCTLTENNVYSNSSDGIDMVSGSLIRGNTIRSNGHYGVSGNAGNRIEGNDLDVDNSVGIYISGTANTILNNSVTSNDTGLWLSGGHNYFAGNLFQNNSVSTTISANNTAGDGTTGFVNTIIP